jgi:hypothetical protein
MLMRCRVSSKCSSFSELVSSRQLRVLIAATKFFTLSSFVLKDDWHIDLTWNFVFWPCWVIEAFLILTSIGIGLLLVGAVCTWAANEAEVIEVFACAWLLFTIGGAAVSWYIMLTEEVKILNGEYEVVSPLIIIVLGYLLAFVIITASNRQKLA